ncbi:MAG: 2OG-Fe(II) oxygenase [Hyphomicrobiales bacterium]
MILDFDKLAATPLERYPYEHIVVKKFVYPEQFAKVSADFPKLPGPGLHPPSAVALKGAFAIMLEEICSDRFRDIIARTFEVDLEGKPLMATIRGFIRARDGQIHTDSESKIITVLIYLNESWEKEGGNLRLLRNGTDIDDYVMEISPIEGTLLVFRRSDHSWHGHLPFEGPRRTIQLNWVTDRFTAFKENARHFMGSKLKAAQESLGARG